MSKHKTDPESRQFIQKRYQDTSVVIFKEQQRAACKTLSPSQQNTRRAWDDSLADGASSSHPTYRYSRYGNEAVIIHQEGKIVGKRDLDTVQSAVCVVM